jgi:CubicO group peptidase (beta-lactamase class C family)
MTSGLSKQGLARLDEVVGRHVEAGRADGAVWAVSRRGERHVGWAGARNPGGIGAVAEDSIFRIASMSKPVTAVAALTFVEDCTLRLDDPIDDLLPELADRQVLRASDGPLDDTVPAVRAITLRDLLTFRLGWGMDFSFPKQTVLEAMAERGLGAGPPQPQRIAPRDEWLAALSPLPLEHQPGERFLYHVGADVLGALLERATGRTLEEVLRERVLGPLGMVDTSFSVPTGKEDRFGSCVGFDLATGEPGVYDAPDGQWSAPPPFASGGAGLVSTIGDYLAFAEMLARGGTVEGERLLSRPTVELMTTNQLTAEQRDPGPSPDGSLGWGFGVGVQCRRMGVHNLGSYGWEGGLGSSWHNDPIEDLCGVILTTQMFTDPTMPVTVSDFWTAAYAAIDD